jgi:phosphoglucosamine mutase
MKVFGTDGLRDSVNGPLLDPQFVQRFGRAVARWAKLRHPNSDSRLHAIIGRDTRASGKAIFHALADGLAGEGIGLFDAGICPTPAISMAVRELDLELGFAITASHNPATDNGIKIFGPGGSKLPDGEETAIENLIAELELNDAPIQSHPVRQYEARRHYMDGYAGLLPANALMGLKIVVDASNGATYQTTAELLQRFGAYVTAIHHSPDGENINAACGSEYPYTLRTTVREIGADLGIAHDGDGDRLILCDHRGDVLSGDALLAILATHWAAKSALPNNGIVATVMSNLALDKVLESAGICVHRCGVGDRQVFFKMREHGISLGGESSGHIISLAHLPTGDGLLAALLVLRAQTEKQQSLRDIASIFTPFPQSICNLKVRSKPSMEQLPALQEALRELENKLGNDGRLLLRYSGTEPKVRLLVEAATEELTTSTMDELKNLVHEHLPIS